MSETASLRVASWNVNGLRAVSSRGFSAWLTGSGADIVGLQETRATVDKLDPAIAHPPGWWTLHVSGERPGYSGVALYARTPPDAAVAALGEARFDREGRFSAARWGRLWVVNAYFPNGNGKERDNARVPYKLDFYRAVFDWAQRKRKAGARVLVMGDYNTAHREIDLARPRENQKTSGFLPAERAELDRWLAAGWLDTFRAFEDGPGHYSWWTARAGARARNVGWRIDMILATPNTKAHLLAAGIERDVMGSDHCPVTVTLAEGIRT